MAFVIEQKLDEAQYHYDREGDVLSISFGPPLPAVSLTIEGLAADQGHSRRSSSL
jgi:hypothetical protein